MRLLAGLVAALAFIADAEAQTDCSEFFLQQGHIVVCQRWDAAGWTQWVLRRTRDGTTLHQDSQPLPRDEGILLNLPRGR